MVRMPVLETVSIRNYGLYPGLSSDSAEDIKVDLSQGVTLILGANGIGKSTFVQLLYRMLSGPFDIPGADSETLGRANLEIRELSTKKKRYFSERVNDGAAKATARLEFTLGSERFTVSRNLRDLRLTGAARSTSASPLVTENDLQSALTEAAGLGSFSDWILLLRYVTFYQEDRRALVWDAAAQRQILRPLFLPAKDSNAWVAKERRILQLDSERRNISAVIYRRSEYLREQQGKASGADEVRKELESLQREHSALLQASENETDLLVSVEENRKQTRVAFLLAENELEDVKRQYEHVKLSHIAYALPDQSSSARYILAQMISSGLCVACGQNADEYREQVESRLEAGLCALCGKVDLTTESEEVESMNAHRLQEVISLLEQHNDHVDAARTSADEVERSYRSLLTESRASRFDLSRVEERLSEVYALLPESTGEMQDAQTEYNVLRRQLARADAELDELRSEFDDFIARMTENILSRASELEVAFSTYASAFLIETNRLTWAPVSERVGQMGASVSFPHFGLEMSGNDFPSATSRDSSDSVSESQREFVDLAFRMALVTVASRDSAGTLVIDSPDSSLDAVFEPKAAEVLNAYIGSSVASRLVLTSNLSSGEFLPSLVNDFRDSSGQEPGLLDLFDVAAPTAAVRQLWTEYLAARDTLFDKAGISKASVAGGAPNGRA